MREKNLYPAARKWLYTWLKDHGIAKAKVLPETETRPLGQVLEQEGVAGYFPESSAWDVRVDVVGLSLDKRSAAAGLYFIELKLNPIRLVDVGQLLGYCRVCRPRLAMLLSPTGLSRHLEDLLLKYRRLDVLTYDSGGGKFLHIHLGRWNDERREPDELLPPVGSVS